MPALQSDNRRRSHLESKDALRAHIDQLPPDKQCEFVVTALQLMAERPYSREFGIRAAYRQLLQREMSAGMI